MREASKAEGTNARSRVAVGAAVVAIGLVIGAGVATANGASVAVASGAFVVNPAFVAGPVAGTDIDDATNPADGATGRVHLDVGVFNGTRTNATLHVAGLPAHRTFGAHLHRDDCSATFGGPHYQHPGGTPSAPATTSNEVWLDVTTNAVGRGHATATVPFSVLAGMRSVVVHQRPTDAAGGAGARLACMPIAI